MIRSAGGKRGHPLAAVQCDGPGCSEEIQFPCPSNIGATLGREEGKAKKRAAQAGWRVTGSKMFCPTCSGAKTPREQELTHDLKTPAEQPPRSPSKDEKRTILALLTEVYDTKAGRYTGGETDKTVADAIGGGVMFGWVAQLREEFFGPDGGNEEIEALHADIAKALSEVKAMQDQLQGATMALSGYQTRLSELSARVNRVKEAVGPKAAKV